MSNRITLFFQQLLGLASPALNSSIVSHWMMFWGFSAITLGSVSTGMFFLSGLISVGYFFKTPREYYSALNNFPTALSSIIAFCLYPIFFLVVVLTSLIGNDFLAGLNVIGSYLHWLLILPISAHLLCQTKHQNLMQMFVTGMRRGIIVAFCIAVVEYSFTHQRVSGMSGNSLIFAQLSLCAGAFSLLIFENEKRFERVLSVIAALAAIGCILLSASRGIILLTFPLALILGWYYFIKIEVSKKSILSAVVLVLVFALSSLIVTKERYTVEQTHNSLNHIKKLDQISDPSIQERVAILLTGIKVINQNPLLGVGLQNTVDAASNQSKKILGTKLVFEKTHLHNDYLNHLAGGGILLGFVFIAVIFSPLVFLVAKRSQPNWLEERMFVFLLVYIYSGIAFFNVVFRQDLSQTFFCFGIVLVIATFLKSSQRRKTIASQKNYSQH